ncbi:hypothetical protein PBAL39_07175 [Pedobacter sp. BAL39]|uniref:hypothetical protein n=1 Tax=Pedobacter sp. BAL39 TaxID=391596 RepID=UPI000155B279|nr:hypothetical protein [Pedobacter sp. BAL39]EDM34065.1 hypothetical protein PBAL39_07175 [Pedobacter sp. BAL39]
MMNQEDIFKKIGLILNELQDQYEYLAQNPQQLNELELELFMANAHFLTDHVQIVQKINNTKIQQQLPEAGATKDHNGIEETAPAVIELPAAAPATTASLGLENEDRDVQQNDAELTKGKVDLDREEFSSGIKAESLPLNEAESLPLNEYVAEDDFLDGGHHVTEKEEDNAEEEKQEEVAAAATDDIPSLFDKEVFKIDNESSSFEFILKDSHLSDKFDFEEKSIDDIFDRPLSKEEEFIIAQKQKLRAQQEQRRVEADEEDEIGPEPFLVAKEEDVIPPATTTLVPDQLEKKEMPMEREVQHISNQQPPELQEKAPQETDAASGNAEAFNVTPVAASQPLSATQPEKKDDAKLTLNERLAGQMGAKPSTANSGRQPLTDLKHGININDKMLYVKDLFSGYGLAYAEVIDQLNKMPDFKSADAFLQNNYAVKNNWAAKQGTVDKFYELLNQRFPAQ